MENLVEFKNITKIYPGVVALDNISMSFASGEIHALMGENGAGKSTLIKVLSGAVRPDEGSVFIAGREMPRNANAITARNMGVSVVYQELNLVPALSVGENVFLGEKLGNAVFQDFRELYRRTDESLHKFGLDLDSHMPVSELSNSQKQLVEIAKALSRDARVLVLDEPTSSIGTKEARILFELIDNLRKRGMCIIYVTHRIDEVFEIADRVSIMRDGCYIDTVPVKGLTRTRLVQMMVGREVYEVYPERPAPGNDVVLEVEHLYGNGVSDISFSLHNREILGLAGLVGAGRTELAKVIFGAAKMEKGTIKLNGQPVKITSPQKAIEKGIGLIPEDRKGEGIFLDFPVDWNSSIVAIRSKSRHGFVDFKSVDETALEYIRKLRIKTPALETLVKTLSGGNQQKVALAKTLAADSRVLIFDEPTRGIDVGAKQEIYKLMAELTEEGYSILMITSEMEELMGMSDRIIIMYEGHLSGELSRDQYTQENILKLESGFSLETE